jgi:hypothetical protein
MVDVGMYFKWPFGIFYEHVGFFMLIWYILCSFGTLFPVSVSCTKKNRLLPRMYIISRCLHLRGRCVIRTIFFSNSVRRNVCDKTNDY